LTNLVLNGAILDLTAGETYVFNISGSLTLNQSEILDSTGADVLFNITGTQGVQLAGGLNDESVLDGTVLAPDASNPVTPGMVVGEIISGGNISIASGGGVQGITSVPDSGSSLFLLAIGIGCLGVCGKIWTLPARFTTFARELKNFIPTTATSATPAGKHFIVTHNQIALAIPLKRAIICSTFGAKKDYLYSQII
jgi:hypothetical protein